MADTTDPDARPSLVGATLHGKYQLTRRLGSGGFGDVYEAVHATTGKRFAVKTLHAHLVGHAGILRRFTAEARASIQIEHDHVVEVFDLDVDPHIGIPYIVQELLKGEALDARLKRSPGGRLPIEDALRIAIPMMGALVAAHAKGIVHRDLKPANLFLAKNRAGQEVPKVIDFGIAKFLSDVNHDAGTKTGALLGSPSYMSPEQAMGLVNQLDAQTDVWAMGVVLYEMLTGRLPYEAPNYQQVLGMIQYREPTPLAERDPSLPRGLRVVIDRALTRDRAVRYPTMQTFLDALLETAALGEASTTLPLTARPSVPVAPTSHPVVAPTLVSEVPGRGETLREGWSQETVRRVPSSRSRWVLAAVVACVFLGGGTVAWMLTRPNITPAPHVAAAPPPSTEPPPAPVNVPVAPSAPTTPPTPAPPVLGGAQTQPAPQLVAATTTSPQPRRRVRSSSQGGSPHVGVPATPPVNPTPPVLPPGGVGEWGQ